MTKYAYRADRDAAEIARLKAELEASGWRSPDDPPDTPHEDNGAYSERVIVLERKNMRLVAADGWYVAPDDDEDCPARWRDEDRSLYPVAWMPYPIDEALPGGGHGE